MGDGGWIYVCLGKGRVAGCCEYVAMAMNIWVP